MTDGVLSDVLDRKYIVTMPDGSRWAIPVQVIAQHRAREYNDEFDGNTARSLEEDTVPLFDGDSFEIRDWASNNMDWDDVKEHATLVTDSDDVDYQEGWVNGNWEVV